MNIYLWRGSETAPKCDTSKITFYTLDAVLDFRLCVLPWYYQSQCFNAAI